MDLLVSRADILIFYANAFDSKGEDGSTINGCTVHYMFWGENGTALISQSEPDVTKPVGMQRGKSWVDYSIRNKIRIAPAIYEGKFKMDVDSKGKPVLKLVDVAYKSNVKMQAYKLEGLIVPGMIEEKETAPVTAAGPVTSASEEPLDNPPADKDASDNLPADKSAADDTTASNVQHGKDSSRKTGKQP